MHLAGSDWRDHWCCPGGFDGASRQCSGAEDPFFNLPQFLSGPFIGSLFMFQVLTIHLAWTPVLSRIWTSTSFSHDLSSFVLLLIHSFLLSLISLDAITPCFCHLELALSLEYTTFYFDCLGFDCISSPESSAWGVHEAESRRTRQEVSTEFDY